jgi:hypothetical protein
MSSLLTGLLASAWFFHFMILLPNFQLNYFEKALLSELAQSKATVQVGRGKVVAFFFEI